MIKEELKETLIKHQMWLEGVKGGKRADLKFVNLGGTNLRNVDLRYADLNNADLRCTNLFGADLYRASLNNANLSGADLYGANLSRANLSYTDLSNADLRYTDLSGADLSNADLNGTDLRCADLHGVYLCDAKGKLLEYRQGKILSESITGYKMCVHGIIVKLEIPKGALVFSINGNKCRTNKVIVKEIYGANRAYSIHGRLSYYVGDKITINNFNCEYNVECATGIHFFMTREEAEKYGKSYI